MRQSLLIAAGAIVSIAAACSGPDFQSAPGGSGGSSGMGGSKSGKGGSSSSGGSTSSGGTNVDPGGGPNPGTGGSQVGSGGGSGLCTDSTECPQSSNRCVRSYCDPNRGCVEENVPDGPLPDDVPGDCRYTACEGGFEIPVHDSNDFDDGNECTSDTCTMDDHLHEVLAGAVCSAGICDYGGVCRECDLATCPDPSECTMPMCMDGGCGLGPRPRGTLCDMGTNQCDGEGNCVDCTDNGGCGECCVCVQNTCVEA